MALGDTRSFGAGKLSIKAPVFQTGDDFSVYDHLKYIGISTQTFAVPVGGKLTFSSTIQATAYNTQAGGRLISGSYIGSGNPYSAIALEGPQAGAVMNMIDLASGQLFDWFISGSTAFTRIERLPSSVTNPSLNPGDLVSQVDHVGVPLDQQGATWSGVYPSYGAGELLAGKLRNLSIGHGPFSLLDAYPFQHPDRPDLAVSIPLSERLFGQGMDASFDNFTVTAVPEPGSWALLLAGLGLVAGMPAVRRRRCRRMLGA